MNDEISKTKSGLESCRRMLLLADFRAQEGDLHEAISVLKEALVSVKQASIEDSCLEGEANQLKVRIFLQLATIYSNQNKAELAVKYAEEGKNRCKSVLSLERGNVEAQQIKNSAMPQQDTVVAPAKVKA